MYTLRTPTQYLYFVHDLYFVHEGDTVPDIGFLFC